MCSFLSVVIALRFEDLICWQLSVELRDRVLRLAKGETISKDFKFCNQLRDSASSVPRNIAEGFGRFDPGDFARFASIARASLDETRNHIRDAREREYLGEQECADLLNLTKRVSVATTRMIKYLRSRAAKENAQRARQKLANARKPGPVNRRT